MRWKVLLIAAGVLFASSAAVVVLAGPGSAPDGRGAAGLPEPTATIPAATPTGEPSSEPLGVPTDSPACEKHGCDTFVNPGGNELHLPQPAVDGMTHAEEHRATDPPHGHPHEKDGTPEPGDPDGLDLDDDDGGHGPPDDVPRGRPHAD